MSTYSELKAQAEELLRKAEEARKTELKDVIARLKADIATYGVRVEDLFPDIRLQRATPRSRAKSAPRYRGPNGETWSGGPGRKPEWVRKVVESGGSIEDYKI